ncbi:MMT2 [Sanghuangporus weigelae]
MFGRRVHFSSSSYKAASSSNATATVCRHHNQLTQVAPARCLYFPATTPNRFTRRFPSLPLLRRLSSSPLHSALPFLPVVAPHTRMSSRRVYSSSSGLKGKQKQNGHANADVLPSDDEHHEHSHAPSITSHSHSHSMFSGHTHSRDDGPGQDVEGILQALRGRGDRGSRITLLGLVVNVGLTGGKGMAGWYMNSAALLAEAGHSASDLLGDLVTLFAWRFSRRAPTLKYPYGFGKFETLGTTTVALILVAGALGIGAHSLTLLTHHLIEAAATLPPGPAQTIIANVTEAAQSVVTAVPLSHGHGGHVHGAEELALDPNAAWFALASSSGVLLANAVHHRADAYTSLVALVAILSSSAFPAVPLDPLGGVLVAMVILRQGLGLFWGSFGELTDAGVRPRTRRALEAALVPLVSSSSSGEGPLRGIRDLRALRAGALLFVDLKARVAPELTVAETARLEERIADALRSVRKEIAEVRVKFVPADDDMDGSEKEGEHENEHEHEHGHTHGNEHEDKLPDGRPR